MPRNLLISLSRLALLSLVLAGCAVDHPVLSTGCDSSRPITPIHQVQGGRAVSPLQGSLVQIEGIVVGDFQHGRRGAIGTHGELGGFAVQEEAADADGDPATSEGVFVVDGMAPRIDVSVGDRVCVTGPVKEVAGETRIVATERGSGVAVTGSGFALPPARVVTLPAAGTVLNDDGIAVADLERFESEHVQIAGPMTVTDLAALDRFGVIIHGARSVLARAKVLARSGQPMNRLQRWAIRLEQRVGHNKATVAVANKMARMCWAVWKHRTPFEPGPALR